MSKPTQAERIGALEKRLRWLESHLTGEIQHRARAEVKSALKDHLAENYHHAPKVLHFHALGSDSYSDGDDGS